MSGQQHIDFASMLAASIHDMKNSLGMVLNSLENVFDIQSGQCHCTPDEVGQLQYEAKRVNDNLVQLLTLYKMETGQYGPSITETVVLEFLEDCYYLQKPLLDYRGVETEIHCDPYIEWYFDPFLLESVLNNVITNAVRYTRDRLVIAAVVEDGWLHIRVEDNGAGFPEHMLREGEGADGPLEYGSHHTKLGLYFCSQIARSHSNGSRQGRIELSNDGVLEGGRFSIYLP